MIEDPDRYLDAFVDAGAAMLSVHVEVLPHLHRTIAQIKKLGAKAGVVLNPSTPVVAIEKSRATSTSCWSCRSIPGFGGQSFIPRSIEKIRAVRALLDRAGNAAPIEVDGGIDLTPSRRSSTPGADCWSPATRSSAPRRRRSGGARAQGQGRVGRAGMTVDSVTAAASPSRARPNVNVSCVRVRYAETDKMGVVYYANYLVWFEIGRTDWLRDTGWTYRAMEDDGFALPVIEAHCEYRQGARYDDEMEIQDAGAAGVAGAAAVRLRRRPARRWRQRSRPGTPCTPPSIAGPAGAAARAGEGLARMKALVTGGAGSSART